MLSLFFAGRRLVRAIIRVARVPETQALLITTAIVIATGTVFYALHERWGVLDALYFTIMTLATVGYGDLVPTTALSKGFTIVYTLTGIGLLATTIGTVAAAIVDEERERRAASDLSG